MTMTVAEHTRLVVQIAVLKEVAMEYPTRTIENIIVQMDAMKNEVDSHPEHSLRNNNRQKRM